MLAALVARLLPFKASIIVWAFIALLGVVIVQGARLKAAQTTVTAQGVTIASLQAQLATQNAAVEALRIETLKRDQVAVQANAAADKALAKAQAEVARIKASGPKENTCESALQWLVEEVQEMK